MTSLEDSAVLQTGIGGIPDAVLPFLLRIVKTSAFTELISASVIPLIEAGVLTEARKNFKSGKIIAL